jgi:hypothetical protein
MIGTRTDIVSREYANGTGEKHCRTMNGRTWVFTRVVTSGEVWITAHPKDNPAEAKSFLFPA